MASGIGNPTPTSTLSGRFKTTQWGLVAAAAQTGAESRAALATLCEIYWRPLYAYLRRGGHSADEAEDLTQGFFAMLLETRTLKNADPHLGRFRSYLLGALQHFLSNESNRAHRVKRGRGWRLISLDRAEEETRLHRELMDEHSPERLFDRQWGLTILKLALEDLREHFVHEGKGHLFCRLQPCLAREDSQIKYRQLGVELQMSEGAVKVAMHRMRRKYRQLLREQIGRTVRSPEEIDDEIRHLFVALRA